MRRRFWFAFNVLRLLQSQDDAEKTNVSRIAENLEWAQLYFASDPAGSLATLEEMYRTDRDQLLTEAIRLLSESGENPGTIGVVAFLLRKNEVLPLLCQSAAPRAARMALAKLAVRADAQLNDAIAARILDDPGPDLRRNLLEILSHTHARAEVVTRLAGLVYDPNPRVQSKVLLLLARVAPEGEWVSQGLSAEDPRVRANVVEALWKQKSEFARRTFLAASSDPHHRVAANAIYGLYQLGDPVALPKIRGLLLDNDASHRRAGLWLVERTGDPRYLAVLGRLIGKVEPETRARCLRVIQAVKARKESAMQRGTIAIDWFPQTEGHARLSATLAPGGRRLTGLQPFDFVLHAGGHPLDEFRLTPRQPVLSRTIVVLVGDCPDWKRGWSEALQGGPVSAADRFGFLHYRKATPDQAGADLGSFRLLGVEVQASVKTVAVQPVKVPEAVNWCGKSLASLRRMFDYRPPSLSTLPAAVRQAAAELGSGENHLVVIDQQADRIDGLSGCHLHVITGSRSATALAGQCQSTGGLCLVANDAEQAARHLAELHRGWLTEYEVTYPPATPVDTVEVCSEWGYGMTMVGAQGLEPRASSV
jgi:hypothetical protein